MCWIEDIMLYTQQKALIQVILMCTITLLMLFR